MRPAIKLANPRDRIRFELPHHNMTDETMYALERFGDIPDTPLGVSPNDL